MPQAVVHPRPDSETGTFSTTISRHRLAYYDGANPIQFEAYVGVQGGTGIFVYQITSGPTWLNIGQIYGSPLYGVVYGTPTSAISKLAPVTVTVRVWNQDQINFVDVTWTLATSSSTADFIFLNAVTGSDSTGNGTYGNPYQTLSKVIGATTATTTFPGVRVYMFGGNTSAHAYQWPAQTGGSLAGETGIDVTKVPGIYMGIPGTGTVYIDASVAQLYENGGGWNDLYVAGSAADRMTINGSSATALDTHGFKLYHALRCTWDNIDFTNPVSRANGSDTNATSVFANNQSSNGVISKHYWCMHNCTETGRTAGAGNSMLLVCWFDVANFCIDFCTATGVAGFGMFLKNSNQFGSVSYCPVELQPDASTSGDAFLFGGQEGGNTFSNNLEVRYCWIRGGAIKLDFQGGTHAGVMYSYRNTVYRTDTNETYAIGQNGGVGPYTSDSDVLIAKGPAMIAAGITGTGTEVQASWVGGSPPPANCPINTTTGALVNINGGTQYQTLYSKTANSRGWEIG